MCDTDEKCLRTGEHPGQRHRFTMTKAERSAADRARRTGHLSSVATTKVGRFTIKPGDAIRLALKPGEHKWLGIFDRLETNSNSGITTAVVVGGKLGGACLTRNVDPARLIYLRPDSADARKARVFVGMSKVSVGGKKVAQ